jgi:hypothetical protein
MLMQIPTFCGTAQVGEEVNGAGVRVAHTRVVHRLAAGNIVLVVPFHGIDDVPLLRLGLSDDCYKVTSWLVDNGTVWHWGLGLWLRSSSCSTDQGMGKGSVPCTSANQPSGLQGLSGCGAMGSARASVRDCSNWCGDTRLEPTALLMASGRQNPLLCV